MSDTHGIRKCCEVHTVNSYSAVMPKSEISVESSSMTCTILLSTPKANLISSVSFLFRFDLSIDIRIQAGGKVKGYTPYLRGSQSAPLPDSSKNIPEDTVDVSFELMPVLMLRTRGKSSKLLRLVVGWYCWHCVHQTRLWDSRQIEDFKISANPIGCCCCFMLAAWWWWFLDDWCTFEVCVCRQNPIS